MAFPTSPTTPPSLVTFPRIVSVGDPSGFTLTRANWQSTTPDILQAENTIQYGESNALRLAAQARLVGVVPNTLFELVNSRTVKGDIAQLATTKVAPMPATIEPYKYRIRRRQTRMSYFNITAGTADPAAGTTDANGIYHPTSSWKLTLNTGIGQFATPFKELSRFFNAAGFLSVTLKDTSSLVLKRVVLQILTGAVNATVDASDGLSVTVLVAAPYPDASWSVLSATTKGYFQPTFGLVDLLANNVSDWESYANNAPIDVANELLTDWVQTTRETYATNDLWLQGLADAQNGDVNDVVKRFQTDPFAMLRKQMAEYWERVHCNTCMYGARIDVINQIDNPSRTNILALPTVTEHEDGNIVDRKANAVGVITQLEEQGRVFDYAGAPLNLNSVFQILWEMRRNRQIDGKPHDVIDLMMDRFNKRNFDTVLLAYIRSQYGFDITQYVTNGKTLDSNGMVMFEYSTYDLPLFQFKVAIISSPSVSNFFEDRKSAFGLGTGGPQGTYNNKALGNEVWAIDWSDIEIQVVATNSVSRDYRNEVMAQTDPFYAKCMKLNTKHYELISKTFCVALGDFQRHAVFRNFGDQQPILNYTPASGLTHS